MPDSDFIKTLHAHTACFDQLPVLAEKVERIGRRLAKTINDGFKIMICGNGGSAADAQHFAAEIIGRFEQERSSWPAIALTTDTSILTAIGNDYGFADLFTRQVQGLGRTGDALIGLSTSGNSENVFRALSIAKRIGITTIGLLGREGGKIKDMVDEAIVICDPSTARIQEAHIFILHFWALAIERQLTGQIQHSGDHYAPQPTTSLQG